MSQKFAKVVPAIVIAATLGEAGSGTANNYLAEKRQTVEYCRIFDLKTGGATRQTVAKAASNGLGRSVNNANEATLIPMTGELPEKAGRFKRSNPLAGSSLAGFAEGTGSLGKREGGTG